MSKRKKILSGIFALVIGLSVAVPMRASADDHDHDVNHHYVWHWDRDHDRDNHGHAWQWQWDRDHYRGHPYAPVPGYAYGQRGYLPPNGEGMINPNNPNLYWACDSQGHHCHWAPRH
jgi:hypothetical protein